ncbi:hypothetical protein LY76DRAFT_463041, partial [Colletotrichum caudatum]
IIHLDERVDCDCKYDCNSVHSTTDTNLWESVGRGGGKTPAAWDLGQESRAAARKPPCPLDARPRLLVCSVIPAAAA